VPRGGPRTGPPGEHRLPPALPRSGPGHPHHGRGDAKRLDTLRQADSIVQEEMRGAGLYNKVWQSFAVLAPVKTVGVMGDERTYEDVIALRMRGQRGRHDRGLVAGSLRAIGQDVHPHHQRGQGRPATGW
jgi:hypothetical protein